MSRSGTPDEAFDRPQKAAQVLTMLCLCTDDPCKHSMPKTRMLQHASSYSAWLLCTGSPHAGMGASFPAKLRTGQALAGKGLKLHTAHVAAPASAAASIAALMHAPSTPPSARSTCTLTSICALGKRSTRMVCSRAARTAAASSELRRLPRPRRLCRVPAGHDPMLWTRTSSKRRGVHACTPDGQGLIAPRTLSNNWMRGRAS